MKAVLCPGGHFVKITLFASLFCLVAGQRPVHRAVSLSQSPFSDGTFPRESPGQQQKQYLQVPQQQRRSLPSRQQRQSQQYARRIIISDYETPNAKHYRSEDGLGNYNFGYDIDDGHGGGQFRREWASATGVRRGAYGIRSADGLVRVVHWVADRHGYRAAISTNEPGVVPHRPAHAIYSRPPATGWQHALGTSSQAYEIPEGYDVQPLSAFANAGRAAYVGGSRHNRLRAYDEPASLSSLASTRVYNVPPAFVGDGARTPPARLPLRFLDSQGVDAANFSAEFKRATSRASSHEVFGLPHARRGRSGAADLVQTRRLARRVVAHKAATGHASTL